MTLRIDLSPELESKLKEAASRRNVGEEEYARNVLEKDLGAALPGRDQTTLALLAKWAEESRRSTPEEVALAEREWEVFRKAMNEDASSGRPVYP